MVSKYNSHARKVLAVGAMVVAGIALWAWVNSRQESHLVRTDPDTSAADETSMKFALPRGKALFDQHCAGCHGRTGQGSATLGSANLTNQDWLYGEGTAGDIEAIVKYGIRAPNAKALHLADMPAFAREHPYAREPSIKPLAPHEINDVIQFLRTVEKRPADAAAAQRGAKVYEAAGCYDCHGANAAGDSAVGASNLADQIWLYGDGSNAWIYDSIAQGRAGVCPAWTGRLSAIEIREVVLYVYSLSKATIR